MLALNASTPTVLLVFPEAWLALRQKEWEPLSAAASQVGFNAVVAHWEALALGDGVIRARHSHVRKAGTEGLQVEADVTFKPQVVLTTWGVDTGHQDLYQQIIDTFRSVHSEFPLLSWLDGKCELEQCLRNYERRTGRSISRPPTRVSDEISADDSLPGSELVIVKPSRSGKCRGIEIVPRSALPAFARERANGTRPPFVVQSLVDNVFLYQGRRWDIRVHAIATSLSPLRYRLFREGVAKTTGAVATPGSANLDEWLNAESHLEGKQVPENLPLKQMLDYVGREYTSLHGFWERVDDIIRDVFASIALYAEEMQQTPSRTFLFPGFDFIVERRGDRDFAVRLLELNSHPGLGWEPHISEALMPVYCSWFEELAKLAREGSGTT